MHKLFSQNLFVSGLLVLRLCLYERLAIVDFSFFRIHVRFSLLVSTTFGSIETSPEYLQMYLTVNT